MFYTWTRTWMSGLHLSIQACPAVTTSEPAQTLQTPRTTHTHTQHLFTKGKLKYSMWWQRTIWLDWDTAHRTEIVSIGWSFFWVQTTSRRDCCCYYILLLTSPEALRYYIIDLSAGDHRPPFHCLTNNVVGVVWVLLQLARCKTNLAQPSLMSVLCDSRCRLLYYTTIQAVGRPFYSSSRK